MYKSQFPSNTTNMIPFLGKFVTPSVAPEVADVLESPLTLDEVIQALRSMQSDKASGSDVFPTELKKKFYVKLVPLLLSMYN